MASAGSSSDGNPCGDRHRDMESQYGMPALLVRSQDHVSLKVEHPRPTDITPECTSMLEKLMLAQAQEIFFEKASLPSILCQLA